jgi:phage pi2 protein 07
LCIRFLVTSQSFLDSSYNQLGGRKRHSLAWPGSELKKSISCWNLCTMSQVLLLFILIASTLTIQNGDKSTQALRWCYALFEVKYFCNRHFHAWCWWEQVWALRWQSHKFDSNVMESNQIKSNPTFEFGHLDFKTLTLNSTSSNETISFFNFTLSV